MKTINLKEQYPEFAKEWDVVKNGELPDQIQDAEWWEADLTTHDKIWWRCVNNHRYMMSISQRIAGESCPHCNNKFNVIVKGENDLATTHPHLVKYWDYDKNGILPTEVLSTFKRAVWWKCDHGHKIKAPIDHKVMDDKNSFYCPTCRKIDHRIATYEKKWESCRSEILKYWDNNKNIITSFDDIDIADNTKFWWICDNKHSYQATIIDMLRKDKSSRCPICKAETEKKGTE